MKSSVATPAKKPGEYAILKKTSVPRNTASVFARMISELLGKIQKTMDEMKKRWRCRPHLHPVVRYDIDKPAPRLACQRRPAFAGWLDR